jgi:RNA polymerase sigma factor (sigma-70 family)
MHTPERNTDMATGDNALGGAINRALRRAPLTAAEERRLARRAADGEIDSRDRLVERNLRLVVAIARTHRGRGVPHADLVQEGMIGLLRALESFDEQRGYRLATYATWWIRRSMLRAIADAATIRLPAEGRRELATMLRTERGLTTHGRPRPTSETLAIRSGVPLRRVERLRAAAHVVASLDEPTAGDGTTFAELVADGDAPDPASALERAETARDVVVALSRLEPRVGRILRLRFGLAGGAPLTHEEIGRRLGMTAERSRQLEAEGLRRLRALAERASPAA